MAFRNKYENFFKVWRSVAQNSVKLWRIFLQDFRDTKSFGLPKYRTFTFESKKVMGSQTWQ